jgi:hypothetical protein
MSDAVPLDLDEDGSFRVTVADGAVDEVSDVAQFDVNEDGSFYVTIADGSTVYETYGAAVDEVQDKLEESDDAFVAEMTITGSGDDVEVNLEQVEWPKIISDMNSDD